ncbi:MAG: polysaccharide pyruvyl transferase family protein [Bacteroidales bacterium]|nr:polysaccharide pyruvyl transferase family protein [Bacteroidales bacterium]
MKVGILTFHRAHNYGAVLQCYALQTILQDRGHDVHVIDYRQPWIEDFYKVLSINMLRRNSSSLKDIFAYLKKNAKKFLLSPCKTMYFRKFSDSYLKLTSTCASPSEIPQDFDCYVIGSDQLWSRHCFGGGYDPVYMGGFPHPSSSRVIGYAISADMKSVMSLEDVICGHISAFSDISMREKEIAEKVESMAGRSCSVCLDPTLLTDACSWNPVIDDKWKDRNYVLVYEVRWTKEDKGLLIRRARELASRLGNGCEVIDLSSGRYSVRDFVSLFKYARYVVTTSFHGTVFSILFETPFYALPLWNGYDLRYVELLSSLGLECRLVGKEEQLSPDPMDFSSAILRLEERRCGSFMFIDNALK